MVDDLLTIKPIEGLDAIQKAEWGRFDNPDFPFADYDFLRALETSGSVGEATGWMPCYLTASSGDKLQGASYLYKKENSYGEYIFDWAWAEAYQRYQVPYFPKLLSAVPFTPATGPKFLFAPGADRGVVASAMISRALRQMESENQSSLHYLFITPEETEFFQAAGFLIRHSFQYHWGNPGYGSFSDFLGALKSRKHKQIAREREQLRGEKLTFRAITGEALTSEHAKLFYGFYLSTITKMGAIPYLSENFFTRVFETMRDRIVLFVAEDQAETIAGSLCYFKGSTLYGRYWGTIRNVRNLHFELCYYRPIEWAIERGLKKFEAGAQGEHKIARGFLPALTYSAHWIRHPQFREAISRYIEEEKSAIRAVFDEMRDHSPFGELR